MAMAAAVPRGETPCLFHAGLVKYRQAECPAPGVAPSGGRPWGWPQFRFGFVIGLLPAVFVDFCSWLGGVPASALEPLS